jgi:hypothetical protein
VNDQVAVDEIDGPGDLLDETNSLLNAQNRSRQYTSMGTPSTNSMTI